MSVEFRAVLWNRQKRIYDGTLGAGVALFLSAFVGFGAILDPQATAETLLIRALGTCAFLMLHLILCIGPLARFDPRFLPLLYNRRHLGVAMFIVALAHGLFSLVQFHALGDVNPLVSLLEPHGQFPFQVLGFAALVILLLMASTSHDFWLQVLTPGVWKRMHMSVYAAYVLLVAHVAFGALQSERSPLLLATLCLGVTVVCALHLLAGLRERRLDHARRAADEFIDICAVDEIADNQARIASFNGERVAVFRYGGMVSAVSNVCRHQNGPLGEGRIIDGCITCPWHGYQYRPDCGASPPPFTDKVETFDVRVHNGRVLVHPRAHAPGTYVEPARVGL